MLQQAGYADEEVIALESGKNLATRSRIDLVATDVALYLWSPIGGLESRFTYDHISDVWAPNDRSWHDRLRFSVLGLPGGTARFGFYDLTVSKHELQDYVVTRSRGRRARRFHVTWEPSQQGASFAVLVEDGIPRIAGWVTRNVVDPEDVSTSMLVDQDLGELEVALGLQPSLQYTSPRPGWMPLSRWRPPLPGTEEVSKVIVESSGEKTVATAWLRFELDTWGGYLSGGPDLTSIVPDEGQLLGLKFVDDFLKEDGRSAVACVTEVTTSDDAQPRVLIDGLQLDLPPGEPVG